MWSDGRGYAPAAPARASPPPSPPAETTIAVGNLERGDSDPYWSTVLAIVDALGLSYNELGRRLDKQRQRSRFYAPSDAYPNMCSVDTRKDRLQRRSTLDGMADGSAIEWTGATWNPVTGCSKVSPGCAHCYAETFAERWRGVAGHPYEQGFDLKLWPNRLDVPLRWRRPRMIFVNSMSDLFHEDIPPDYIAQIFDVMNRADWHVFQILTKREDRLAELAPDLPWPDNVWMGVTIENRRFVHRADRLREVPAAVRFISAEPLLGPLAGLDLTDIHWLISGGESGPKHRPVKEEWLIDLRDRCGDEGVAYFFKQWGGVRPKSGGRLLDGREWNGMPATGTRVPALV
jgi:protein gp37